jgi:hypothetical protein
MCIHSQPLLNLYVKPDKPVVSYLTKLTGAQRALNATHFGSQWFSDALCAPRPCQA